MRILALCRRAPFPPDRGDRIRSFQLLRRLSRNHEIHLVSGDDGALDRPREQAIRAFCESHEVRALSPLRRVVGAGQSLLADDPLSVGWCHHPGLQAVVRDWSARRPFDVALVFGAPMAPYWVREQDRSGLAAVMDFVDVESEKWGQHAHFHRGLRRWLYRREQSHLARFEEEVAQRAAVSVFVSEVEAELFRRRTSGRVESIENGVDGGFFERPELTPPSQPPRAIFVGPMDDPANVDAVCWYAERVHPRLRQQFPELVFEVVGANPTHRVQELRGRPGIRITGWVEDVRPYLWAATVAVAPLRISRGTQNRVLEAMAAAVPVVATFKATRGLGRSRGPHLKVAEDSNEFVEAVSGILKDPKMARDQTKRALEFVAEHHSWGAAARRLEDLLQMAADARSNP